MGRTTKNTALVLALACPVAVFVILRFPAHVPVVMSAVIAVLAGWAANVAWATSVDRSVAAGAPVRTNTKTAALFGWLCPAVFVAITWSLLRFAFGRVG